MSTKVLQKASPWCVALTAVSTTSLTWGQQSPMQSAALEEIVVTAQKRSESVQDVPISIAVLTGNTLRTMGANDYTDFLNAVPSVTYAKNGAYKDKIFIRGLSDSLSSRVLSTTGIYIDETPITEVDASLGDIGTFDINRVEVLRGPQGTLFGSGSMGGTVRIITNRPDATAFSALLDGTVSGTSHTDGDPNYETNAMANIPLVADRIAIRAVGGYRHDGGFIDNLADSARGINDDHTGYARVQAELKLVDGLEILLGVQYQQTDIAFGPNQDVGLGNYNVYRLYPEDNRFTTRIYTATINYTLPFATLTSATSQITKSAFSGRDLSNAYGDDFRLATGATQPNIGIGLLNYYPNKAFTQELRLASSSGGPLHWLAGLYFNDFNPHNAQILASTVPALAAYDFGSASITSYRRELAEFGEVSFDITSRFQVTAGLRHSRFVIGQGEVDSGYEFGDVVAPVQVSKQSKTVSKFRADYKLTNDHLIYALAAQGYRPGGPVSNFDDSCLPELHSLGYNTPPTRYNPDSVWSYELGSKNEFLDHRLTLNLDGYFIKWDQTQVAQNLQCGYQYISNAGGAHTRGVELEMQARPLPGLDVSFGGAYTKATFTTGSSEIGIIEGGTLPNVPTWTLSAAGDYRWTFTRDLDGFVHSDLQYIDSRYSDLPLKSSKVLEPAYTLVNARAGVARGPWEISVFARNIGNVIAIMNTTKSSGLYYQSINPPRTVGLEFKRSF